LALLLLIVVSAVGVEDTVLQTLAGIWVEVVTEVALFTGQNFATGLVDLTLVDGWRAELFFIVFDVSVVSAGFTGLRQEVVLQTVCVCIESCQTLLIAFVLPIVAVLTEDALLVGGLTHHLAIVHPVRMFHTLAVVDSLIVVLEAQDTFDVQDFNIVPNDIGLVVQITVCDVVGSEELCLVRVDRALVVGVVNVIAVLAHFTLVVPHWLRAVLDESLLLADLDVDSGLLVDEVVLERRDQVLVLVFNVPDVVVLVIVVSVLALFASGPI
jgi:hypothetical protein